MNIGKKIVINSFYHIGGKIIASILGVIIIAIMTRYLGQQGFGQFSTITAFTMIFAILSNFGLNVITPQMIAEKEEETSLILSNIITMRILLSSIILAIAPILSLFFPYSIIIKKGIIITIFSYFFISLNETLVGFFQQRLQMHFVLISDLIDRIILLIAILLIIKYDLGLLAILTSMVLSNFGSFYFLFLIAKKKTKIKITFNWQLWKKILSKSWPLALTIGLNLLYLRTDTVFLSIYQSQKEVGIYGAAYKLIDALTVFPMMFAGLIMPILTQKWIKKDLKSFSSIFQKSFDILSIISLPLLMGGFFTANSLMTLFAGKKFTISGDVLRFLLFALVIIYINVIFSYGVIAINKQHTTIWGYLTAAIVGIIGYIIFIPKFSYFGAASITILTELIVAVYNIFIFIKNTHIIPSLQSWFYITISTLIMGIFLFFTQSFYNNNNLQLIVFILISIIIYFSTLFMFWKDAYREIKEILF